MDTCWTTLRGIEDACQSLFRECLAIVQVVRGAGLDNGLCEIGDALLQDLGHGADLHWGRFTILAESESIVELGSIVRLRFPEVSIWSLPVAAHEYGHFVGPRLEVQDPGQPSRHPFQDFLEQIREDDPRYYYYGHEFFADLFATYALGPSFACCCILLRFDPVTASTEYSTHPSAAQRVYWLLSVLRAMDEQDPFLSFSGIIKDLENWWSATLAASGQSAGSLVSPDASSRLDSWRDELFAMVEDHLPPGTRYGGWPQAIGWPLTGRRARTGCPNWRPRIRSPISSTPLGCAAREKAATPTTRFGKSGTWPMPCADRSEANHALSIVST